jgi:LacI family transcriptional regulator
VVVKKATTIREIAGVAGVSAMTVSLALRGSREVSVATRKRIQELAESLGYRPNPMVSALMQQVAAGRRVGDGEKIAMISTDPEPEGWQGNFWLGGVVEGAREQARELGFGFEVFWGGHGGCELPQLGRTLYHRGIRGLIFLPMPWPHRVLDIEWAHFCPVTCTLSTGEPRLPCVTSHHSRGAVLLLDLLRRRGASSVGFLQFKEEDARIERMFTSAALGYAEARKDFHLRLGFLPFGAGDADFECWFRRKPMDVLVASSHDLDAPRRLEAMGHKIGRTIGYAELSTSPKNPGRIAGVFQRPATIGREAVRHLAHTLTRNEQGLPEHPLTILVDPVIADGSSLDCLQPADPRPAKRRSLG